MRRVRGRQARNAEAEERTYWPGPWLHGTLAALGGSSVVGAFVYAVGWTTAQAQARFLGVPPGVFDRTACTFNACRLLPESAIVWVHAPIAHLRGDPCPALAVACVWIAAWGLLWGFRKLGPRGFEWPRPLAVTEVAIGVMSLLSMFTAIIWTSGIVADTSALLCQDPAERLDTLEQSLAVPCGPMFPAPSVNGLLGEPEGLNLKCLITGAAAWAFLAQALWSWSLWRRLGVDGRHCTGCGRALALLLAPVARGALVLMLGLAALAFLQVNGTLMPSYHFPVLEDADASRRLVSLGHDGRFFYVYDCQEGKLSARKSLDQVEDSEEQGWTYAEAENVVKLAYDTARASLERAVGGSAAEVAGAEGIRAPDG